LPYAFSSFADLTGSLTALHTTPKPPKKTSPPTRTRAPQGSRQPLTKAPGMCANGIPKGPRPFGLRSTKKPRSTRHLLANAPPKNLPIHTDESPTGVTTAPYKGTRNVHKWDSKGPTALWPAEHKKATLHTPPPRQCYSTKKAACRWSGRPLEVIVGDRDAYCSTRGSTISVLALSLREFR
jgi:hypothetical protein